MSKNVGIINKLASDVAVVEAIKRLAIKRPLTVNEAAVLEKAALPNKAER